MPQRAPDQWRSRPRHGQSPTACEATIDGAPRNRNNNLLRRLIPSWSLPDLTPAPDLPHLPVAAPVPGTPRVQLGRRNRPPHRHRGTRRVGAIRNTRNNSHPTTAIEAQRGFYEYQLRRHGVPATDLQRAAAVVVEALIKTVSNDRGRWIFAPEHSESRSEWALTGIAGGRLTNVVIDRSFVDQDGTRWVIDFKTSRHEGGGLETFLKQEIDRYRPQLETYMALARAGTDAGTRAREPHPSGRGLYFPLLDVLPRADVSSETDSSENCRRPCASGEPRNRRSCTRSGDAEGRAATNPCRSNPGSGVNLIDPSTASGPVPQILQLPDRNPGGRRREGHRVAAPLLVPIAEIVNFHDSLDGPDDLPINPQIRQLRVNLAA